MKTLFKFMIFALVIGSTYSCSDAPEGKKVEAEGAKETAVTTSKAQVYSVDTGASAINWTGTKPGGQHTGTIGLSSGNIAVVDGNITAGEFTIDMSSITNTDMAAGEGKEKLEGHLKTGDFFETEKYPTGKFEVTSVNPTTDVEDATHTIEGNLTMKGTTKSVKVPANVAMADGKITAVTPAFTINRTEWGITFKSGVIGTVKDKSINDEIGLVINLVANAK